MANNTGEAARELAALLHDANGHVVDAGRRIGRANGKATAELDAAHRAIKEVIASLMRGEADFYGNPIPDPVYDSLPTPVGVHWHGRDYRCVPDHTLTVGTVNHAATVERVHNARAMLDGNNIPTVPWEG